MAGSPAHSLKEIFDSPIARSDPNLGGHELGSDEMVLSVCYSKKDHEHKRARQDSEQRVDEKRVEKELNSPEHSLTTCISHGLAIHSPPRIEYWLPSPEYLPYSPKHSPTTPPYVPDHSTGCSHTSPYYSPEYRPARPNHSQDTQDYTPTDTGSNIKYDATDGGFVLGTSFRAFTGCQYQEEKKFKRARQDCEQMVDEKRVEKEQNSPEYSLTTRTSHGPAIRSPPRPEYWPFSPAYWPYSSERSPTTPPYVPDHSTWCSPTSPYYSPEYRPTSLNHCQEAYDYTPTGTGSNIRERQDSEQRIDENSVEDELKSPEYSPTSTTSYGRAIYALPCPEYWLRSPGYWPESPTTPPYDPDEP